MRDIEELEHAVKDSAINAIALIQIFDETVDSALIIKALSFHVRSTKLLLKLQKGLLQAQESYVYEQLQHFLTTISTLEETDQERLEDLAHQIAMLAGKDISHE